jgi:hypothetical protein
LTIPLLRATRGYLTPPGAGVRGAAAAECFDGWGSAPRLCRGILTPRSGSSSNSSSAAAAGGVAHLVAQALGQLGSECARTMLP